MSDALLRQLAMLRLIPRSPRSTDAPTIRKKLAEEGFEVDVRTVQRDLETLSSLFPLGRDETGKPYRWSWDRNALHELPGMDPPTALTLALAHRFLDRLLPRSSLRLLEPHFRNAENQLKELRSRDFSAWPGKVRVLPQGQRLIPAEVDPSVLEVVYEALLKGRRFSCSYRRKGERAAKAYEVNPLGLVVRDAVSYLVATLWDYPDPLQLTLHRMSRPALLEKPATAVAGFDLDRYIAEGAFGYRLSEQPIRLKVRFAKAPAQHLYETALGQDQTLTEEPDTQTVLLEATVLDTEELRWWLLGFGDQVEVLEPGALRAVFRGMAERLYREYSVSP